MNPPRNRPSRIQEIWITEPCELVRLLRSGDRLLETGSQGYRLMLTGVQVDARAVWVLKGGRSGVAAGSDDNWGVLAPLRELGPDGGVIWAWAEGRSDATH